MEDYNEPEPELEIFAKTAELEICAKSVVHSYRNINDSPICFNCNYHECFSLDKKIYGHKQTILHTYYICEKCDNLKNKEEKEKRDNNISLTMENNYDKIIEENYECNETYDCVNEPKILDNCLIYDRLICDNCAKKYNLTEKTHKLIDLSDSIYICQTKSNYNFICPECKLKHNIKYEKNEQGNILYVKCNCNNPDEIGLPNLKNTYDDK